MRFRCRRDIDDTEDARCEDFGSIRDTEFGRVAFGPARSDRTRHGSCTVRSRPGSRISQRIDPLPKNKNKRTGVYRRSRYFFGSVIRYFTADPKPSVPGATLRA